MVVDQWALVREGIGTVLRNLSIRVVADTDQASAAVHLARQNEADLAVVGLHLDVDPAAGVVGLKALDPAPIVVSVIDRPDRDLLRGVLTAGADAVLLRSSPDPELASAVARVAEGEERWVTPALSMLLAGAVGQAEGPTPLTAKETQVLAGLAAGRTNRDLAEELFVSPATIKTHLNHIYAKLGVSNRRQALRRAVELGLLA